MNTAKEILRSEALCDPGSTYEYYHIDDVLNVMKIYAKKVAEQALKDASERAITKAIQVGSYGISSTEIVVNKKTILETLIITP